MLDDKGDNMEYVIAAALEEGTMVPEDMTLCEIPAGDYLVYETTLANYGETWDNAIKWMERNAYTIAHGTSFEFYDERMGNPDPNQQLIDVYIPIARKKRSKEL